MKFAGTRDFILPRDRHDRTLSETEKAHAHSAGRQPAHAKTEVNSTILERRAAGLEPTVAEELSSCGIRAGDAFPRFKGFKDLKERKVQATGKS